MKMASPFSSDKFAVANLCQLRSVSAFVIVYLIFTISLPNQLIYLNFSASQFFSFFIKQTQFQKTWDIDNSPTKLSHLAFGVLGSEGEWHFRKQYIESWWRPNKTRGFLYLDKAPATDLLPWSVASPPYRVSDNLTMFLEEIRAVVPMVIRLVHGIKEVLRDVGDENLRWVVMGDDDSIFFVDNIVDVLVQYDHNKYYYIGGASESMASNVRFSFNMGFGGAGIVLSYTLAKALADDMENCLRRHAPFLITSDSIVMACVGDIGVDLSPNKGLHQIDLQGDISGFLSSHPKSPVMSLHHLDMAEPIFPKMNSIEALRHLMKAAAADQSRTLQQVLCHERQRHWTISVSWGYSAHIYERIMPRSHLLNPIHTFVGNSTPFYMFNTRMPTSDPCEAPHIFFLKDVNHSSAGILTTYSRAAPRQINDSCPYCDNQCPHFVTEIHVFSLITKRTQNDRCECCDFVGVNGTTAEVKFRECNRGEIIA
ncbi:hypothetical protein C2S52_017691 [Perilla frutescens var. hirtella]|nr:hypothetical protein C2S52_017691 [Perilla frutescens var. hirtella]KAH6811459.1 hypothetical protein C2S51_025221 [Perilla frutescens var. frutescens]